MEEEASCHSSSQMIMWCGASWHLTLRNFAGPFLIYKHGFSLASGGSRKVTALLGCRTRLALSPAKFYDFLPTAIFVGVAACVILKMSSASCRNVAILNCHALRGHVPFARRCMNCGQTLQPHCCWATENAQMKPSLPLISINLILRLTRNSCAYGCGMNSMSLAALPIIQACHAYEANRCLRTCGDGLKRLRRSYALYLREKIVCLSRPISNRLILRLILTRGLTGLSSYLQATMIWRTLF